MCSCAYRAHGMHTYVLGCHACTHMCHDAPCMHTRVPEDAVRAHECATGHHTCTHVCWGVPCIHTHVLPCSMHAHTCAKGCQACTHMCHGTACLHTCTRGHQACTPRGSAPAPRTLTHNSPAGGMHANMHIHVPMHTRVPIPAQGASPPPTAAQPPATGPWTLVRHQRLARCLSFPTREGAGCCPVTNHRPG